MTYDQFVQELRAVTVICPREARPLFLHGHGCDLCDGTGRVPSPMAQAVLEAVTEEAQICSHHKNLATGLYWPPKDYACSADPFVCKYCGANCRVSGPAKLARTPKDFAAMGEGAPIIPMGLALKATHIEVDQDGEAWTVRYVGHSEKSITGYWDSSSQAENVIQAAMEAVLAACKEDV